MSYTCFDVSIADNIAHIILNRPDKRNSMIAEFWDELPEIIDDIDRNTKARVIVISSEGPHFSAGLDLSLFTDGSLSSDADDPRSARIQHGAHFYGTVKRMQNTFSCLENSRLPVLVAIQGGCFGGGVDMITACDMRYATEDAFITIFETNIGMTADVGTFPRISRLIPDGIARELAYTGRNMAADEAKEYGLFNRVFPDREAMLDEVFNIAREIASKAPIAVYGSKRMMNYSRDHTTEDSLDYVATWNTSMLQKEEIEEAITANSEKRAGAFAELPRIKSRMKD